MKSMDRYSHYVEAPIGPKPVTVYGADGRVKRIITSDALAKRPAPGKTQGSGRIGPRTGDVYPTVAARKRQTPWHPTRGRARGASIPEDDV